MMAERCNAEFCYCRVSLMLSVINNTFMLSVVMLNVVIHSVEVPL